MAGSPQIAQGTLNRLRGSVVIPAYPQLTVTAPFLGKAGISVAFEGETTTQIPTMTGTVQSPQPYQPVVVTIAMLKTNGLSSLWEAQRQLLSLIGDINVIPDSVTLPIYTYNNCAIQNVRELNFAGEDAGYVATVIGYYQINSSLWSLM